MIRPSLHSRTPDCTTKADLLFSIVLLLASLLLLLSALVGLTGVLLNSRPILAFYNLLLWPTLLSMCLVGYTSYKRGAFQLDRKLNQAWSQFLDDAERLRVQEALMCCGYFNPFREYVFLGNRLCRCIGLCCVRRTCVRRGEASPYPRRDPDIWRETYYYCRGGWMRMLTSFIRADDATYSKKCYPRTTLPGCKGRWTSFERQSLHDFSTAAFSAIPLHLVNIVVALLCSNHVNRYASSHPRRESASLASPLSSPILTV